jgi:hypothetical protein
MHFKPSAGIFVAGLLMSIIGPVIGFIGVGIASSSSRSYYSDSGSSVGGGFLAFLGFATALVGIILVYVGATRALRIIDALPHVLNFGGQGQPSHVPASQPPAAMRFEQAQPPQPQQWYTRPQTPQHLIYKEPHTEQQPPVQ